MPNVCALKIEKKPLKKRLYKYNKLKYF